MIDRLKPILLEALPKDFILDLEGRIRAEALKAFEVVRDHVPLNPKRTREAVGQLRFRMQEQGFQDVCQQHGASLIEGKLSDDLPIYQPFARFSGDGFGIILGFATMPEAHKVPARNISRSSGVTLNYNIAPRLDFDGSEPKPTDIFVMFLVSRDPARPGFVEEVAIGVIDAEYKGFLHYEPMSDFLAGYADIAVGQHVPIEPPTQLVKLKSHPARFVPPEVIGDKDEDAGKGAA
jgi:hypothetical protein